MNVSTETGVGNRPSNSTVNPADFYAQARWLDTNIALHSSIDFLKQRPEYRRIVGQGEAAVPYLLAALQGVVILSPTQERAWLQQPLPNFGYLAFTVEDIMNTQGVEFAHTTGAIPERVENILAWAEGESRIGIRSKEERERIAKSLRRETMGLIRNNSDLWAQFLRMPVHSRRGIWSGKTGMEHKGLIVEVDVTNYDPESEKTNLEIALSAPADLNRSKLHVPPTMRLREGGSNPGFKVLDGTTVHDSFKAARRYRENLALMLG